jgi:hypothetical protein
MFLSSHYFPMYRHLLVDLEAQVIPSHRLFRMFQNYPQFPNYHWYQNFHRFLVGPPVQEAPLHHHDQTYQNYQTFHCFLMYRSRQLPLLGQVIP